MLKITLAKTYFWPKSNVRAVEVCVRTVPSSLEPFLLEFEVKSIKSGLRSVAYF